MERPDLVTMGRASGAFGVKGEVRVYPYTQDPEVFRGAATLYLGPNPEAAKPYTLLDMRPHAGRLLMRLAEVTDREAAQALSGAWVYLKGDDLAPLADDEYYWFQLKGATVLDVRGRALGTVRAVTETGAHDMLVVVDDLGREFLIPLAEDIVRELDADAGRVVVNLPEGLIEAQLPSEKD